MTGSHTPLMKQLLQKNPLTLYVLQTYQGFRLLPILVEFLYVDHNTGHTAYQALEDGFYYRGDIIFDDGQTVSADKSKVINYRKHQYLMDVNRLLDMLEVDHQAIRQLDAL